MNKMNGGYVMVAYNASQSELEKAYATKRPVIVYDADNIGHYAEIKIKDNTYYVENVYLYSRTFDLEDSETPSYSVRFNILTSFGGELTPDNVVDVILNAKMQSIDFTSIVVSGTTLTAFGGKADEDSIIYLYTDSHTIKESSFDWVDIITETTIITEY